MREALSRREQEGLAVPPQFETAQRAFVIIPAPLVPIIEDPPAQAGRRLMEPLLHTDLLKRAISDLATDLARTLDAKRQGERRLLLMLWRVDGQVIDQRVKLASPSREAANIAALFDERLDGSMQASASTRRG